MPDCSFRTNLKIEKHQKSDGTLALFEKDSYLSVSEWVSEKAKLIRGDPPKIDFKTKGEPPKKHEFLRQLWLFRVFKYLVENFYTFKLMGKCIPTQLIQENLLVFK